MFHGAPGEGAAGAYSITRVPLCLLGTGCPDSGPISGELPREQKTREGKAEEGDTLAGTEPGRGGGGGSTAKSERRGWEVGLPWAGLPWLTPVPFNSKRGGGGHGRLEKQDMAGPGQGRIKILYLP